MTSLAAAPTGGDAHAAHLAVPASEPPSPALSVCEEDTHPWRTFDFEEVSKSKRFAYLADPLMRRGYSLQHRKRHVVLSLFAFHNESLNTWTHLLGGILFSILLYSWYSDLNSRTSVGSWLSGETEPSVLASPPGLVLEMFNAGLDDLRHDARVALENIERAFESVAESSAQSAQLLAQQVAEAVRENPAKLAAFVRQLPVHLQQQAEAAVASWVSAESRVVETFVADAAKVRETVSAWIRTAATDNPQRLTALIASLPQGLDTESRRAAALLKAWLQSESRIVEDLLVRIGQPSTVPSWPLLVFCFGAVMCLGSSALYHWWVGYCQHAHDFMCRVDLGGISFMIWGSSVPLVYYVFYRDVEVRNFYLVVGTLLCASTLVSAALPSHILHRAKRLRVLGYVGAGAFAVLPLAHAAARWGLDSDEVRRYANGGGLVVVGALYLVGAVVYISRFPEVLFPGKFDLVGASHQVWHVLVFAAAVVHYFGVVELFHWRMEQEAAHGNFSANGTCGVLAGAA